MEQAQTLAHKGQYRSKDELGSERRIAMSYEDYLNSFEDSTQVEWVSGEAIVFMPQSTRHQRIVAFLAALVSGYAKIFDLGIVLMAPCEIRLSVTESSREPDLLFLANDNYFRVDELRINGAVDLVVEVISNESVARDRSEKFYEYQANGVREYWVIDPRPGLARADFWVLDEHGTYRPVPIGADGVYLSTVLPNFKLVVTRLLTDEALDHFQALIDMVGIKKSAEREANRAHARTL